MRVVVLGAGGRTGTALVHAALAAGHTVRAASRSVRAGQLPEAVEVVPTDGRDPEAVRRALADVDGVLVAVNVMRSVEWNLWSPLANAPDTLSATVANVVAASPPGRRVVYVSAHGVGDSWARSGPLFRGMITWTRIGEAYADHARAEALLAASPLSWTVCRPMILTPGPATGRVRAGTDLAPSSTNQIRRTDVAAWMVDELTACRWIRQAPTLAGA